MNKKYINLKDNKNVFLDHLISPELLFNEFLLPNTVIDTVKTSRKKIQSILFGKNKRLLVIIGPCSVHDIDSTFEYAKMLLKLRIYYKNYLEIVMRVHFEKPRTLFGWKGFIYDPDLNDTFNINKGLRLARKLLVKINNLGVPVSTEFLDTILCHYISDLISFGIIGARTSESQIHRQLASSLAFPIGFKNRTNGNVEVAINSIRSIRKNHVFLSQNKNGKLTVYKTAGNSYGCLVIRGGDSPNFGSENIKLICKQLNRFKLTKKVIVDFSHGNCQKIYTKQLGVAKNICEQLCNGSIFISGIIAESFLIEGFQKVISGKPLRYGQSITDPCLGWRDTEKILEMLAKAIELRNSKKL